MICWCVRLRCRLRSRKLRLFVNYFGCSCFLLMKGGIYLSSVGSVITDDLLFGWNAFCHHKDRNMIIIIPFLSTRKLSIDVLWSDSAVQKEWNGWSNSQKNDIEIAMGISAYRWTSESVQMSRSSNRMNHINFFWIPFDFRIAKTDRRKSIDMVVMCLCQCERLLVWLHAASCMLPATPCALTFHLPI